MSDAIAPSTSTPATAEPPRPTAAEVLHLATAYQASRALHVAIRLGLPDLLAEGPQRAEDLARETGSHAPSLRRLLRALASYGVFSEAADGRFALAPLGSNLRTDTQESVRALALMWGDEDYWLTWAELERCVRTGRTAAEHLFGAEDAFRRYAADARFGAVFNAGMTVLSATVAAAVVAAYDFSDAGLIVDVGGGHGRLIAAILRANPGLRGVLLDLTSVVEGAPRLLAEAGVAERCEVVGGDMFAGVPEGGGPVHPVACHRQLRRCSGGRRPGELPSRHGQARAPPAGRAGAAGQGRGGGIPGGPGGHADGPQHAGSHRRA